MPAPPSLDVQRRAAVEDYALERLRCGGGVRVYYHLSAGERFHLFGQHVYDELAARDEGRLAEVERQAAELLDLMGLSARRDHKPGQLSGGEQQRVAIARALVNSPTVLLADEPSGNLDSHNREEIHRLFFDLRDRLGQTIVVVTHDDHLASMADRKITMSDGEIIQP